MNIKTNTLITLTAFFVVLIIFTFYGIPKYTKVYLIEESPKYLEPPIYEYIEKAGFNWERHYLYKNMKDDFERDKIDIEAYKKELQRGLISYNDK